MLMDRGRWCRRRLPRGPGSGDVSGERHGRRMHAVRRDRIDLPLLRRRSSPPPVHEACVSARVEATNSQNGLAKWRRSLAL